MVNGKPDPRDKDERRKYLGLDTVLEVSSREIWRGCLDADVLDGWRLIKSDAVLTLDVDSEVNVILLDVMAYADAEAEPSRKILKPEAFVALTFVALYWNGTRLTRKSILSSVGTSIEVNVHKTWPPVRR